MVAPLAARTGRCWRRCAAGELVALIADRDLPATAPVTMFGHPTTLPAGPATLALRTDRPLMMARVLRTGPERFSVRAELVEAPPHRSRRQGRGRPHRRAGGELRGGHRRGAGPVVGVLPAVLDRSAHPRGRGVTPAAAAARQGGHAPAHALLGRDRRRSRRCSSTSRRRPTWTWWRSPITSAWTALRARDPCRRRLPLRAGGGRGDHHAAATCWPCSSRSASRCGRCPRRGAHPRAGRPGHRRPSAGAADAQPRRRSLLALHDDPDPRHHLDAIGLLNPSAAGRARRLESTSLNEHVLHLAAVGNSDAHVLEHVGTGWTWFPGTTAADHRRPSWSAPPSRPASTGAGWHNVSVYGRQLVAKARHLRHTLRPTGEWR